MEPINTYLISPILIYGYLSFIIFVYACFANNQLAKHSISFPLNNSCSMCGPIAAVGRSPSTCGRKCSATNVPVVCGLVKLSV